MDESGVHSGASSVAVGAYFAKSCVWRNFTKEWNTAKRPIKVFHSTDCQHLRGEFKGWSKERRDDFVANLLRVIRDHHIAGLVIGIQMDDFRAALDNRPDLINAFGNPYGACVQWALSTVMQAAIDHNSDEPIQFVHEVNDYKGEALSVFDWLKSELRPHNTVTLEFGGKSTYVPLQAADILAYEGSKFLRNPAGKPRRAWLALDPDRKRIVARRYGHENMPHLVSVLERMAAT